MSQTALAALQSGVANSFWGTANGVDDAANAVYDAANGVCSAGNGACDTANGICDAANADWDTANAVGDIANDVCGVSNDSCMGNLLYKSTKMVATSMRSLGNSMAILVQSFGCCLRNPFPPTSFRNQFKSYQIFWKSSRKI